MRREPGNQYDSNAIRIDNVAGVQIGHIPRGVAGKLAKFMDNSLLHVEGELAGYVKLMASVFSAIRGEIKALHRLLRPSTPSIL